MKWRRCPIYVKGFRAIAWHHGLRSDFFVQVRGIETRHFSLRVDH